MRGVVRGWSGARLARAGLLWGMLLGATAAHADPAARHGAPATRNAAIATLMSGGFSSVTALNREGATWTGQGVRHAALCDFTIDDKGVLSSRPVH